MSESTNPPQLFLLYTFCAAFVLLPRLTTHMNTPVTASLVSHLITSVGFLGTLTFLIIDSLSIISKLLFMLMGWLLRISFNFVLSNHISAQWQLPGTEATRFWIKIAISAITGLWLTWKLFFNSSRAEANSWETAKRNIAAKREEQKVEQGNVARDSDYGAAWVWAACSFAYVNAILDSREWVESRLKGGVKVERSVEWEWVCLWAPMLISALVGFVRWRWSVAAKTRGIDVRKSEKKELGP